MIIPWSTVLHWTPRLLCVAFAVFLSIFALDVFHETSGLWNILLALAVHLIPTYVVLTSMAIAWRWPLAGALLFCGLGILYVVWAGSRMHWTSHVVIAGPCFLLGTLYLLDYMKQARLAAIG